MAARTVFKRKTKETKGDILLFILMEKKKADRIGAWQERQGRRIGGVCYHVLNRDNGRAEVFHKKEDYIAFLDLMAEAGERLPVRLLAWRRCQTTFIWFCGRTATET